MTLARVSVALSALFLVFMLGMATAPSPVEAVQPARPLRVADLRLDAPAVAAAAVIGGLEPASVDVQNIRRGPVLARTTSAPPPPALPPPEVLLRQAVAAVTEEGGRLGLVLGGSAGRRLHEGDTFMGWRLASVTRSSAVLTRGRERREAAFFASAPSASVTGPPAGGAPAASPPAGSNPPPTAAEFFRGFKG